MSVPSLQGSHTMKKIDYDKLYDTVNEYLEEKLDELLLFVDNHRYPLIVTFSVHLLLVILIANVTIKYYESGESKIVAVSMEELQRIEEELRDAGVDRLSIDARLSTSNASMSGFTNQAAADLGEDVDISRIKQDFSTLQEAKAVTKQVNEYGEDVRVDLFSEQVKNRDVNLDEYQKIDKDAYKGTAREQVYTGKSTVTYGFDGSVKRHNIEPVPVPVYTVRVGGLVVVDVRVNRAGRVVSAQINREKTKCTNEDAYEKAVTYARRARFNVDESAPEPQPGYISYEFQ